MRSSVETLPGLTATTIKQNTVFLQAIKYSRLPLCVTDPTLPDGPIVFANQAFYDLTGYDESEVLGNNCRFLQGEGTDQESIASIREILASQEIGTVEIVNYRKNGEEFINALQLGPVFNEEGKLIFYFGSQMDVTHIRKDRKSVV